MDVDADASDGRDRAVGQLEIDPAADRQLPLDPVLHGEVPVSEGEHARLEPDEEGIEQRWERHQRNHRAFVAGIEAMGLKMLVEDPENRLWTLNTPRVPAGIDDAKVRKYLLEERGMEISGGLGPLAGKVFRIGLMGYGSQAENVTLVLEALGAALKQQGF